jgi:hypothetical protein
MPRHLRTSARSGRNGCLMFRYSLLLIALLFSGCVSSSTDTMNVRPTTVGYTHMRFIVPISRSPKHPGEFSTISFEHTAKKEHWNKEKKIAVLRDALNYFKKFSDGKHRLTTNVSVADLSETIDHMEENK